MKKVTFEEATVYEAPGHHDVVLRRFSGKDVTGAEKFWVGMSHFEPHGGAGWGYADNACEKVYYILEGQMTVKDATLKDVSKEEIDANLAKDPKYYEGHYWKINAGDAFFMGPNEERYFENETDYPVKTLVIITYPGV
jgi:quercetin dioxygenase-like cupin family protein